MGLLKTGSLSLSLSLSPLFPFHLSIPYTSLSLSPLYPFTSLSLSPLYPFHLSLFLSFSLSLSIALISPSLSISLLLPFFLSLSLLLYLFSLSFSLAYLMDVFVLVNLMQHPGDQWRAVTYVLSNILGNGRLLFRLFLLTLNFNFFMKLLKIIYSCYC